MDDDKLVNTISRIYAGVRAEGDYVDQNYYETRTRAALAIIRPAVIKECAAYLDSIHHNSTAELLRRALNKGGGDE